jgi:hypothetical protein
MQDELDCWQKTRRGDLARLFIPLHPLSRWSIEPAESVGQKSRFAFDDQPEVWIEQRERPSNWGWTIVHNGHIWHDEELVPLGGYDARLRLRGDADRAPPQQKQPMETRTQKKSDDTATPKAATPEPKKTSPPAGQSLRNGQ